MSRSSDSPPRRRSASSRFFCSSKPIRHLPPILPPVPLLPSSALPPVHSPSMPLPVLPADLHPVILEQLVEPISLERFPPHYKHLRAASLVCKDWAKTAQKLLYKHVYLVLEEHRLESFLAGEPKTNWTIQDLALQAADVEGLSERCTELLDRVVDIVRQKPPTSLHIGSYAAPPRLLPLAASLITLQLPPFPAKPSTDRGFCQHNEGNRFLTNRFLPACTSLQHLIFADRPIPTHLEHTCPTYRRLSVLTTTQPALSVVRGYLVDPGTSTSLELIHLGSPEDGWTDVMHEEAATLKELCGKRGIKLELQGYEE
ncbi:hypothetical protein JCM10213_009086 [Rhodosporidiobolus nylandii]